jgi:hypothetical protein
MRQKFGGRLEKDEWQGGTGGRIWEAGGKLDEPGKQEADPESALTRRKGMVLEEREVIRGAVDKYYYDEQVTASHNHRAEMGSLVVVVAAVVVVVAFV